MSAAIPATSPPAAAAAPPWTTTGLAERGWLPDALVRAGIRALCRQRLREESHGGAEAIDARFRARLHALAESAIALETEAANRQHYELPPEFFAAVLGPRLKYSACLFEHAGVGLAQAEEAMLALYAQRAGLADGQHILELGCGWGSLSLWMAERYPSAEILAVSNSHGQRAWIEARRDALGLRNLQVLTRDVNVLQLDRSFDRVVSVEMFEHVRNYASLMQRIGGWLRPQGRLFVHIFCHRELMYPFETAGQDNWMGRHFFTGGLMPAARTLLHFQDALVLDSHWRLSGRHYQRTAEAWLANHDRNRRRIAGIMARTYGAQARIWAQRWRMFWMACAELFGYDEGDQWLVAHYLFRRR